MNKVTCSEVICGENCEEPTGEHRVLKWWDRQCEMCEDWWCDFHSLHVYDCTCLLEDWVQEELERL